MEPILSKLQEGVKYPRFERDATKTINDLVDHITKERGVYSSSIEPNPNEHSIWFNTNNNTLYIYDGNTWVTVSDKNVHISKEREEFLPYPVINILNSTSHISEWYIEENKHYVIIINANNIREYLNYIVDYNNDNERQFIIIGDNTNINGTFLVNIYDTYIYYIKLSSSYIEEDNVFYCSNGHLYYIGENTNGEGNDFEITGFYSEEYLNNTIENYEGDSIENINLNSIFIEPEEDAKIIIGNSTYNNLISIFGEYFCGNVYMYSNKLQLGGLNDGIVNIDHISWDNVYVYCNCKKIGDITITFNNNSIYDLYIPMITFFVGNNNKLVIPTDIAEHISNCHIYVINETNGDNSSVHIRGLNGTIEEYVNLCKTKLYSTGKHKLTCKTFISTTIDDLDRIDDPIDILTCETVIIDALYRPFVNGNINGLVDMREGYTTSEELANYLHTEYNVQWETVINNTVYYNDRVDVEYITKHTNRIVYKRTIHKH